MKLNKADIEFKTPELHVIAEKLLLCSSMKELKKLQKETKDLLKEHGYMT